MTEVKNHLLFIDGKQVPYKSSPNVGGTIVPKYLIMHYDAAVNETSAVEWMTSKKSGVSAHLHITRTGKVTQIVPFNIKAQHAGVSEWKGIKMLNGHSLGIELQNNGSEEYTDVQLKVAEQVAEALVKAYALTDVLGHSDISPGRKIDPGKHFPMSLFKTAVMGLKCATKTTTADVHIREGAGTTFKALAVLKKGTGVEVSVEKDGWSEVSVTNLGLKGWVSSKYLT